MSMNIYVYIHTCTYRTYVYTYTNVQDTQGVYYNFQKGFYRSARTYTSEPEIMRLPRECYVRKPR